MVHSKQMLWSPRGSESQTARHLAAVLLHGASRALAAFAARLVAVPDRQVLDPRVEFHAEAGAPEGALFVDGEFVGWLSSVSRL